MRFLKYTMVRTTLDWDIIHSLETKQLIKLRNSLSEIRKMRKHREFIDFWINFENKDFQHIWHNPNIENGFISSLNIMIIKRKTQK